MNPPERAIADWRLRTRTLELGRRTLVMGVVNITPDSFSDGELFVDPEAAVAHALRLLDEGADILDLGAESTRPGSRAGGAAGSESAPAVSAEEEQARLLPVLEGILAARPQAIVSVDTYKAATARAALAAGAEDHQRCERPAVGRRNGASLRGVALRSGADAHAGKARRVAHSAATRLR